MNKTLTLVSSNVIADSGVKFGTSGARGLVTQFTPNVCAAFTISFIKGIQSRFDFSTVAIAIDNRPSSSFMAQACATALKKIDIDVIYYGVLPTPALAFMAQEDGIPAIMVTGSHIPFDRNGLKFYCPNGEISKADEVAILTEDAEFSELTDLISLNVNNRAAEAYIYRYTSLFSSSWLTGKRIGIYEHSSAGRDIYYHIFERLGAEVVSLERSDEFVPIDTEAVSDEDTLKAINWSKKYDLDMVFSTDGDGDRPLVSDENGNWLRGDILGLLAAEALHIEALAIPVSCNTAIEISNRFKFVERTQIGSPYVIAEFIKLTESFESFAGFEANGGFLLGCDINVNGNLLKSLPTRDAVLPAIMLLVAANNKAISLLVNELPQRFTYSDRIQNFDTQKSKSIIFEGGHNPKNLLDKLGFIDTEINNINIKDGLRLTLSDHRIIHLRPSGNAPELRCYVEGSSFTSAKDCVIKILSKIKEM